MFYVVNTMSATEAGHVGRILSSHRTRDTAERADAKLQRAVKRANGSGSYLPTTIVSDDPAASACPGADDYQRPVYRDHADIWLR